MQPYKQEFIELLVKAEALKFGEFELKSGRTAPYFLNVGSFYTGKLLYQLARFYAQAIMESGIDYDVLFGPAYKGIPLATTTTSVLYSDFQKNSAYAFNRKQAKEYAQKDTMVGAPLTEETRVFIIDDVITAGTAVRESIDFLKANGNPKIVGVMIALNRMEKTNEGENALENVARLTGAPVHSIITLDEVIETLYNKEVNGRVYIDDTMMESIKQYRSQYGI
jgi:orotate phosphoribosyltransferase